MAKLEWSPPDLREILAFLMTWMVLNALSNPETHDYVEECKKV